MSEILKFWIDHNNYCSIIAYWRSRGLKNFHLLHCKRGKSVQQNEIYFIKYVERHHILITSYWLLF